MKKAFALTLFCMFAVLCAQESLDSKAFILLLDEQSLSEDGGDSRRFADAIVSSVSAAFRKKGLTYNGRKEWNAETDSVFSEGQRASSAGQLAYARYAIVIQTLLDNSRLSWRIGVYDCVNGNLIASDAYSAFAGLTALSIIDGSALTSAQIWEKNSIASIDSVSTVEIGQLFLSNDSHVSVRYGSSSGTDFREAGTLTDGKLSAEYLPFMKDVPLYIEVYREGYWTKELVLSKGVQETPVSLPPLQKKTKMACGFSTGIGRLLGVAGMFRWYPVPDRFFCKAENAFWVASDFLPGSSAVLHDELRLGAGVYLQKERDSTFRYSIGTGCSTIATFLTNAPGYTVPAGLDFTVEPLWFTLEYHFPLLAIIFEERFPYSLGAESGFLDKGWLSLNGNGPLFFSLGVLYKW